MKIVVTGDFSPQEQVSSLFDVGDYERVFGQVKPIVSTADFSIVNFESTVAAGIENPIEKIGPCLKCSNKSIEALKWAGFDCLTLANNHFFDYGKAGVTNTLECCNKNGLHTVGGGQNLAEASKVLYKEINGTTLAVINCCEHEFSIATDETGGCNPLNPIQQFYTIKAAKKEADIVLIIVHGGHEHYNLPSPRMKETYRFFVDAGADAVVNHHQHCYSGYEVYHNKPIFYGLGNFCFDKNYGEKDSWYYGNMLLLDFSDRIYFELLPYEQCKVEPTIKMLDLRCFEKTLRELNEIISDDKKTTVHFENYCKSFETSSRFVLEPTNNKYIRALQYKGILPSVISKKWLLRIQNHVVCESHFDKFKFYLFNNSFLNK